jgi:hypothetical protein
MERIEKIGEDEEGRVRIREGKGEWYPKSSKGSTRKADDKESGGKNSKCLAI